MATGAHTRAVDALRSGLRALLPLDDDRRDEAIVWLAFSAGAASSATFGTRHAEVVAYMRARVHPRRGAALLAAAIDGLLLHAVSGQVDGATSLEALCDEAIDRLLAVSVP